MPTGLLACTAERLVLLIILLVHLPDPLVLQLPLLLFVEILLPLSFEHPDEDLVKHGVLLSKIPLCEPVREGEGVDEEYRKR